MFWKQHIIIRLQTRFPSSLLTWRRRTKIVFAPTSMNRPVSAGTSLDSFVEGSCSIRSACSTSVLRNSSSNANSEFTATTATTTTSNNQPLSPSSSIDKKKNDFTLNSEHLKKFNLYNWKPNLTLSDDVNYMDLVLLITRNSILKQGSMGCIIVNPNLSTKVSSMEKEDDNVDNNNNKSNDNDDNNDNNDDDNDDERPLKKMKHQNNESSISALFKSLDECIIAATTNESFYNKNDSDIHAEIAALGQCNQDPSPNSCTKNCTAYITMPPCKRCFGALVKAGITRIVTRVNYAEQIVNVANRENIELVNLSSCDAMFMKNQNLRIKAIVDEALRSSNSAVELKFDHESIRLARTRRKEEKAAKKAAKAQKVSESKQIINK
jgi:tRNA(Arg) A34 adenosine deaminase TadA